MLIVFLLIPRESALIPSGIDYRPDRIQIGDLIIVTGPVGDHGLAILAQRDGLQFDSPACSDCAPLVNTASVGEIWRTRLSVCGTLPGRLATVLNELAQQSRTGNTGGGTQDTYLPSRARVLVICWGWIPLYG